MIGRYFGLDTSNSAFYPAAWPGEDAAVIQDRLGHVSSVGETFIEPIDQWRLPPRSGGRLMVPVESPRINGSLGEVNAGFLGEPDCDSNPCIGGRPLAQRHMIFRL